MTGPRNSSPILADRQTTRLSVCPPRRERSSLVSSAFSQTDATMLSKLLMIVAAASAVAFCPTPVCHSRIAQSKVANIGMSAVVDEVMDKLKAMTLLEASELVKVGMDLRSGLQLARGVDTSGFTAQARAMAGEGRWG